VRGRSGLITGAGGSVIHVSRDCSDAEDVVSIHLALLGGDVRSETVNVMQRRATALLDIIEMMNQIAGYNGDKENAPRFPHLHTPDGDYELLSKKALH
jgi:nucleoside-diphosphate-sugar epimerase